MRMPPSAAFCCAFTLIGEFLIETPVIGRYTGDNIHILNILRIGTDHRRMLGPLGRAQLFSECLITSPAQTFLACVEGPTN